MTLFKDKNEFVIILKDGMFNGSSLNASGVDFEPHDGQKCE